MITKNTVKTEVDFNDACSKRYYLSVEWSKDKPRAVVIMLSPSRTNGISFDRSTSYCIDNLVRLGYGKMIVVNLFANIGDGKSVIEDCDDEQNLKAIKNVFHLPMWLSMLSVQAKKIIKSSENAKIRLSKSFRPLMTRCSAYPMMKARNSIIRFIQKYINGI